jgi:ribonuclease P/MRP protein subunit RPP1
MKTESNTIDIVKRLDLDPKNSNELLRSLRSQRWKNEIITVNGRSKSLARQAGRDRRVDLITYPIVAKWKNNHLDRQQAGLMRDSGSGYLIDLSKLLVDDRFRLRKHIEFIKRNKDNAVKRGVPVVASSCATTVWGLRDPYGLAALLSLIDVDEDHAIDMVSSVPNGLVDKNRVKLKDSYILEGVWVIEDE